MNNQNYIYKNISYSLEFFGNDKCKVDFNEIAFTIHRIITGPNHKSLIAQNELMTEKECHKHAKQIIDLFIKKVNQLQK